MNDDLISREAVGYYIQSYIHEIITESGTDKNEHTNSILRAILNGIKTMPSVTPKAEQKAVLDKIIEEIEQKQYDFMDDKDYDEGIRFGLMLAYQTVDKYSERISGPSADCAWNCKQHNVTKKPVA